MGTLHLGYNEYGEQTTDNRIATAGFIHGGEEKQFSYSYLAGSDLLQTLAMPNNMTLTQSYETQRDLLTGMAYKRGTTGVTQRSYSYDTLGRPTAHTTARQGTTKNDTFNHNNRSESPEGLKGAWSNSEITKNIREIFGNNGYIRTAYTCTPYGAVTSTGNVTQPIQWSSEYADGELGLVYYNYRYYNPLNGRWINRDLLNEPQNTTLYVYISNTQGFGHLGLFAPGWEGGQAGSCATANRYKASNMASKTNCKSCCPKGFRYREVGSSCEYRTKRQKEGYTPSSNGCDAENGIKVPDKWFGGEVDFLPACNAHDICYGTCGSDFKKCNDDFMKDMKKACDRGINRAQVANPNLPLEEVRRKCYDIAETYYRAVSIFGHSPYKSAQDTACEWASCRK